MKLLATAEKLKKIQEIVKVYHDKALARTQM
jgi:hypothetical protein